MFITTERERLEEAASNEFRRLFARKLAQAMYEKKMSQAELSDATMIAKATISRYCNGDSCPSGYNIYKISLALDKPVAFFYGQ